MYQQHMRVEWRSARLYDSLLQHRFNLRFNLILEGWWVRYGRTVIGLAPSINGIAWSQSLLGGSWSGGQTTEGNSFSKALMA